MEQARTQAQDAASRRAERPAAADIGSPRWRQVPESARLAVTVFHDAASLSALTAEWTALDASLGLRTPFTTPLWNQLWWRHLHVERWLVRDELWLLAIREPGGRLIGIAPLMRTLRPAIGPLRLRMLQFLGADPNVTELRGLVCRREDELRVAVAVDAFLHQHAKRWDWMLWSSLRRMDSIAAIGANPEALRSQPIYTLTLPERWEAFRERLPRNIKESLRKCYNSLKRDGHAFALTVVTAPEATPAALARLIELHRMRSRAPMLAPHRDVFERVAVRRFMADYARAMSARGELRLFQLEIGGEVVAARLGFAFGDTIYLHYSGFDPRWARYSVMTTLLAEAIRWSIASGYRLLNLSTGRDVSKTRWAPDEHQFHDVDLVPARTRSRLAAALHARLARRLAAGPASDLLAGFRRDPDSGR